MGQAGAPQSLRSARTAWRSPATCLWETSTAGYECLEGGPCVGGETCCASLVTEVSRDSLICKMGSVLVHVRDWEPQSVILGNTGVG